MFRPSVACVRVCMVVGPATLVCIPSNNAIPRTQIQANRLLRIFFFSTTTSGQGEEAPEVAEKGRRQQSQKQEKVWLCLGLVLYVATIRGTSDTQISVGRRGVLSTMHGKCPVSRRGGRRDGYSQGLVEGSRGVCHCRSVEWRQCPIRQCCRPGNGRFQTGRMGTTRLKFPPASFAFFLVICYFS